MTLQSYFYASYGAGGLVVMMMACVERHLRHENVYWWHSAAGGILRAPAKNAKLSGSTSP